MTVVVRRAKISWAAAILSPLIVILMEVFWIYPWLVWAGEWPELGWQRTPLSLLSLILLIIISFFITRFFLGRRWSLRWIQLSIVAGCLLIIFLVVRVEYGAGFPLLSGQWFVHTAQVFLDSFSSPHPVDLALMASLYLCWRGIILGRSPFYFSSIYRSFAVGIIALMILIIVWGASLGDDSLENLVSTVGIYVAGFFFFGLTALAMGNLQAIQRKMRQEEMASLSGRRWLSIMLGVVGGIVLVGIGAVSIFSSQFVAMLGRFLDIVFNLLSQAVDYLLIPFGFLAEKVVYVVQWLIDLIRGGQPPQSPQTPAFFEPLEPVGEVVPQMLSAEAILALKWVFFAVVAIVVIFFLVRAVFRNWSARKEAEIEEIHESLWSWQGFKADLRLFFSIIRRRLERRKKKLLPARLVPGWYRGEDAQGRLGIREIYQHLLWMASSAGITRLGHETPDEYARRLERAVPEGSESIGELTSLYIGVRYGDLEAEYKQVDYANGLWKSLRRLLAFLPSS